jgi:hypothetical protein
LQNDSFKIPIKTDTLPADHIFQEGQGYGFGTINDFSPGTVPAAGKTRSNQFFTE